MWLLLLIAGVGAQCEFAIPLNAKTWAGDNVSESFFCTPGTCQGVPPNNPPEWLELSSELPGQFSLQYKFPAACLPWIGYNLTIYMSGSTEKIPCAWQKATLMIAGFRGSEFFWPVVSFNWTHANWWANASKDTDNLATTSTTTLETLTLVLDVSERPQGDLSRMTIGEVYLQLIT